MKKILPLLVLLTGCFPNNESPKKHIEERILGSWEFCYINRPIEVYNSITINFKDDGTFYEKEWYRPDLSKNKKWVYYGNSRKFNGESSGGWNIVDSTLNIHFDSERPWNSLEGDHGVYSVLKRSNFTVLHFTSAKINFISTDSFELVLEKENFIDGYEYLDTLVFIRKNHVD